MERLMAAYNELRFHMGESAKGLRSLLERLGDSPSSNTFTDGISESITEVLVCEIPLVLPQYVY